MPAPVTAPVSAAISAPVLAPVSVAIRAPVRALVPTPVVEDRDPFVVRASSRGNKKEGEPLHRVSESDVKSVIDRVIEKKIAMEW